MQLWLAGDAEFVHFREGRPPCRPISLLVMGKMISRTARTEAVPPMKNEHRRSLKLVIATREP
jgi:hypothetical protein